MPYTRPSLQQIVNRILADVSGQLGEKASILRRAWTRVWSTAYAGAVHLLYGYIGWVKDQIFLDSADDESIILQGRDFGINRTPPEYASGIINVTGTLGAPIPIGTAFINSAGTRYLSTAPATIGASGAEVSVRAYLPGFAGNIPGGTPVQLESPVAGVTSAALVNLTTPISLGADLETIDSLKARIRARKQNPPQGGARADYESWAKEEPGIDRVFVYGPGEISTNPFLPPHGHVYVYFSEVGSDAPPSLAKINAVRDRITAKMPVTARIQVFGVEYVPVTFTIAARPTPGFTFEQMVTDIQNELVDLFRDGALPYKTLALSQIDEAISRPASELSHVTAAPASDLTFNYRQVGVVTTPITVTPI